MLYAILIVIGLTVLLSIWESPGGPFFILLIVAGAIWAGKQEAENKKKRIKTKGSNKKSSRNASRPKPSAIYATQLEAHKKLKPVMPLSSGFPDRLAGLISPSLFNRSGSVFYSGRAAFSAKSDLYLLGLNPGGSPVTQSAETVSVDLDEWLHTIPANWSAYADESWQGRPPGTCGLQPRVLHLLRVLNVHPHRVPASNVVFVRSTVEAELREEKRQLLRACWPAHRAVIETLGVRAIVCFGTTAANWVREEVGAQSLVGSFNETNLRGWKSEAHRASNGLRVIQVTHPARADWTNPDADPSLFVRDMMA